MANDVGPDETNKELSTAPIPYFAREERTRTGRIVKAPQYLRDEAYYTESGVPEAYAVLTTSEPLFHTKKTLTA